MPTMEIYKRGQGKYTRIITFVSVLVLGVIGGVVISSKLAVYNVTRTPYIQFGVPTLLIVGLLILMYWLVNRPRTADFLIATEGEMKKVSWSSRREVVGSTKVVIITSLILASVLFAVDTIFVWLFGIILH